MVKCTYFLTISRIVDNDIITLLLKNRLEKNDCNNGYILDGYPRNIEQAKLYEELISSLNKDLGVVIFLDIERELAMKRALSRIVCSNCGTGYNLIEEELKPKNENICDKCNFVLNVRNDDNEKTFITRFDTYVEKTRSLIDYYKNKNVLKVVKIIENLSVYEVLSQIEEIVNND